MQEKEQQLQRQQMRSSASKTKTEIDAVTDSILKNISVIGTCNAAAKTPETKDQNRTTRIKSAFKSEQGNIATDDFADFQYYFPNKQNPSPNGSSDPFDDFHDWGTAASPASHTTSPQTGGVVVDKYDVFRELHSHPSSIETREPPDVPQDRISIWIRCLGICKQLLQKSFNALIVSHGEESAIEALKSEPGIAFVNDLHQLYLMTQRIGSGQRSMCLHSDQLNNLLTDVVMTWRPLHSLFNRVTNLPEAIANKVSSMKSGSCYICLCASPPEVVLVNGTPFHMVCANLWTHCISPHLPEPI